MSHAAPIALSSACRKSTASGMPSSFRAGQLQAYLDVLDEIPAGMRDNIEALYHDLFIETCADWVVPYIADLLGTSHLSGDPWTLRADVARTVFHRRRKGTLGAVESLVFTLSGWAAQAVELRNNLAWTQHLNHQRPDAGGVPPLLQRTSSGIRGARRHAADPRPGGAVASSTGPSTPSPTSPTCKPPARSGRRATTCPISASSCGGWRTTPSRWLIPVRRGHRRSRGPRPGEAAARRALHRSSAGRSAGAVQHPSLPAGRRAAEPQPSGRSARRRCRGRG